MIITLRLQNGWSPRVKNVGINGKYNCDLCTAQLFIGPGNVKYCDQVHHHDDVVNHFKLAKKEATMADVRKAQAEEEFIFTE